MRKAEILQARDSQWFSTSEAEAKTVIKAEVLRNLESRLAPISGADRKTVRKAEISGRAYSSAGRNESYIISAYILSLELYVVPMNGEEAKTLRKAEISRARKLAEAKTLREVESPGEIASVEAGLQGVRSSPFRKMA